MNFIQHLVVSFLAVAAINAVFSIAFTPVLVAASLVGAILPDADHANTRIFRFLLAALALTVGAGTFYLVQGDLLLRTGAAGTAALATAGFLFLAKPRHRGWTHHPLSAIGFAALVLILTQNPHAGLDAGVAYGAHLLADRL